MAKSPGKEKTTRKKASQKLTAHNQPGNEIIEKLQQQVANAFILYLNYKHYHWQTFGPLFRDLHKLFDELATEVYTTIDVLAERVRMIGQDPVSTIEAFKNTATIKSSNSSSDMRDMINEANDHVIQIIIEMRAAIKVADDMGDPGTADILTRYVQIHEKHEWWLRDILEKKDGLTN